MGDKARIVEAVATLDPHAFEAWSTLEERIDGVAFVAVEVEDTSFDVHDDGEFSGRANLLLTAPYEGRAGRKLISSLAVPAHVHGNINTKEVNIENLEIRI